MRVYNYTIHAVIGRRDVDKVYVPVLAHVKDARTNRYSQSIIESEFRDYMNKGGDVLSELGLNLRMGLNDYVKPN
jgi:hypothetical protein